VCIKLPDSLKDVLAENSGYARNAALKTHCHREAFHAQWDVIFDDEFVEAYRHGIVIKCCDGVERRFYPRIFTYSADYPEKYVR
jgi:Plavaka transposase